MAPSQVGDSRLLALESAILKAPRILGASVCLQRREFRRKLLYSLVQPSHLIAKFVQVAAKHVASACSAQKLAHGAPRQVRHISLGCRKTKPLQRRVLLFGESDTDLAGTRIQDCHVDFSCKLGIPDRNSQSGKSD